jgi:hypothetical protein
MPSIKASVAARGHTSKGNAGSNFPLSNDPRRWEGIEGESRSVPGLTTSDQFAEFSTLPRYEQLD